MAPNFLLMGCCVYSKFDSGAWGMIDSSVDNSTLFKCSL